MRLCPKCGKIILEDSIKFCDECGADLEAKPVETGNGGSTGGATGGTRGSSTSGAAGGTRGGSTGGAAGGTHGGRGGSFSGGATGGGATGRGTAGKGTAGGGTAGGGNRGGTGGGNGGSGSVKPWMIILAALTVAVIGLAIGTVIKLHRSDDTGSTAEESSVQTETYTSAENSTGEAAPLQPSNGNGEAEAPAENDSAAETAEEAVPEAAEESNEEEAAENGTESTSEHAQSSTQTLPPIVVLTPTAAPTPSAYNDSTDVHEYEVIVADVTWQQAYQNCLAMGGHLLRINSEAEWNTVTQMLNRGGHDKIHFYLGGACDIATKEYHWVDDQEQFFDENIADQNLWYKSYWYPGEPSYQDQANGKVIDEYWMNLMCVSGTWYLNDTNNDLVGLYPDWLKGKVGYIVEYE